MNLTLQRAGRCAVAALVALAALGAPSATAAGLPSPAPTVGVAAPLHTAVYRLIKGREAAWTFKDENCPVAMRRTAH